MIKIKNIYYMLSYAFTILNEKGYKDISVEEFDNIGELFSEILIHGIGYQLKKGLHKDYTDEKEALTTIRGKVDITSSINDGVILKNNLICEFDVFNENNQLNQIIKSTCYYLIKSDISLVRKNKLKKLMLYFSNVDLINVANIKWNVSINKNSQNYRLLISICNLVVKGLIQTTEDGNTKLMTFLDERYMCTLYEKFILEFYKKECPNISASSSKIDWILDDDKDYRLPNMQSDIMLTKGNNILIIDAKYYTNNLQKHYEKQSVISGNLYQIFTYVKNKQLEDKTKCVSGMLLYAKTDYYIQPDSTYLMSGNKIIVRTLDLDQEFSNIKESLISIANTII